ncbi:MAG: nucleotide exchange factor GrpE [Alphaproteobacteria bacterium]|nr:nucleotide exchange factor GrpE [Alphaproteobacteria bacterium]
MEENTKKEVEIETVSIDNNASPEQKTVDSEHSIKIIEELNTKIAETNDKYLRMAAELENTRRRATLDIESVSRNRAMSVAEKFLPVMDAVVAALKHNPDDEGVKSLQKSIENAFSQIGIVKINTIGEILNPQFHNAIQIVDKPTPETATNTIVEEMQTGYMFGDTVLRTAMVIVSK